MKRSLISAVLLAVTATVAVAQQAPRQGRQRAARGYPPRIPEARVEVYKQIGDVKLNIYIFTPPGHQPTDRRPAIVFFFGGGWRSGSPLQFRQHCNYLAGRGMVAMAADYRVSSRHHTKAVQCVADGKSAVRWIRANARRLGIDPERIAAGGGSAGGHVAASTGTIPDLDEPGEDTSISSVPNALVLFNPAVVLAPVGDQPPFNAKMMAGLKERMGIDPEKISPYHHVASGAPPTILFHGTADTTVPFHTVKLFAEKMHQVGNVCKLVPYQGRNHGFFNYGRNGNKDYVSTVRRMDQFLAELGYLQGEPTVE